jgi:hypothetical protein
VAVSVASFAQVANWFDSNAKTITGQAWSTSDVVVVVGAKEHVGTASIPPPTNANLTFASQASQLTGGVNEPGIQIWTTVAASGQTGQTISFADPGAEVNGYGVWVLSGASGTFANASANLTESAFTFTPTAGSVVIYGHSDWLATSGKTITTGTGTATERVDTTNGTNYGVYLGDWAGVTASSASFGISSYTGTQVARGVIEVLGAGGALTAAADLAVTAGLSSDATLPAPSSTLTFLRPLMTPRTV